MSVNRVSSFWTRLRSFDMPSSLLVLPLRNPPLGDVTEIKPRRGYVDIGNGRAETDARKRDGDAGLTRIVARNRECRPLRAGGNRCKL